MPWRREAGEARSAKEVEERGHMRGKADGATFLKLRDRGQKCVMDEYIIVRSRRGLLDEACVPQVGFFSFLFVVVSSSLLRYSSFFDQLYVSNIPFFFFLLQV